MSNNWVQIERIVDQALALPEAERSSFVSQECGDNEALKTQVTQLLKSITASKGWLENPKEYQEILLNEITDNIEQISTTHSLIGEEIGSYLIKSQLGEGGMGSVYLAERADGEFEHRVAIKIIRNEKASPENIRRFEQERTIMAELNHPGIAKLFDGGLTGNGYPYFIMEYVDGIPIDQYCKKNKCSIRERLGLFKQVLKAVRHAHENLIVHRDLKPSNILVNSSGKIKILDFGISKLLQDDQLPETRLTQTNARLLTPKYAAPEQILRSPITTATDIYALGIVFYCLLSDRYPFDLDELSQFKMEQKILETSPQPPSKSVKSEVLKKELKGDLDAITLKAIRKEPKHRYRSANEFLDDLLKFQQGLPVTAQEDSFKYRIQKFYQRNKQWVAMVLALLLIVIGFAGFYTWQITEERNRAQLQSERTEEMTSFLLSLFEANNPRENTGDDFPVSKIIDRGLEKLENKSISTDSRALLWAAISQIQLNIGQNQEAGDVIKKAYQLVADSIQPKSKSLIDVYTVYGSWNQVNGNPDSARILFLKADSLYQVFGITGEEYRVNLINLANLYNENGQYKESLNTLKRIKNFPENNQESLHNKSYYYNNTAVAYAGLGNHDKSLKYYEKSLQLKERIYEPDNPELALTYSNIAVLYLKLGLSQKAYKLFKKAYIIRNKAYGTAHPMMGSTLSGLATTANNIGKPAESEKFHHLAIKNVRRNYGTEHYRYAFALRNYAHYLIDTKLLSQAEDTLTKAHKIISNEYGPDHALNAYITNIKAKLYSDWNKTEKAHLNYRNTINIFKENYGPNYATLGKVIGNYAIFEFKNHNYEDALKLLIRSQTIFEVNNNYNSFHHGKIQYYIGKSQLKIGSADSAHSHLSKAYEIISKTRGDTAELAIEIEELLSKY